MDDLDTLVQGKLDADTDFQSSLSNLADDEKNTAIEAKRKEILKSEWSTLSDAKKKAEESYQSQKTRAEKAEKAAKGGKKGDDEGNNSSKESELSMADVYAFTNAKVHEDDIAEVVKAAKLLDKEPREALKDPIVQAILEKKSAQRKTADAANTQQTRRANRQMTGNEILGDVRKGGDIPERGSTEAEELFWARRGGKPTK